jgi:hypothetical protein
MPKYSQPGLPLLQIGSGMLLTSRFALARSRTTAKTTHDVYKLA